MLVAAAALGVQAWPAAGQPALVAPAPAPPSAPPAAQTPLRPDQIVLIEQTLADADSQGLPSGRYAPPRDVDALLRSVDPQTRQAGQAMLVGTLLRYAKAVHVGRLPLAAFKDDWGMRPPPYDPAPAFARAIAQDQLKSWLDSLPPPYTGYQDLRDGLRAYRAIQAKGGWPSVSPGPALQLGSTGARVQELRARLAAEDPMVDPAAGATFDDALAQAVARAQKRFGLKDDGVVASQTLGALNIPVERRIDQIVANMERWRWLPQMLPTDRIQVNVAAAILTVFHADTPIMSMRAVTGRPGDETPMLQSEIQSIVFNPPWNVPSSIAVRELWPKERANPGYFAAHDFIVIPTGDGSYRLQQKAGPQAALGKIKFDFPNNYGVYLHDTPSRGLFSNYGRLASHGCVRLQRPLELAKLVMQGDPVWTPDVIDQTIASGRTVRAPLQRPVAVMLFYWTAYVAPDGEVNFRQDPYGWDTALIDRLADFDAVSTTPTARPTRPQAPPLGAAQTTG